jgi:hypothetical protein
MLHLASSSSDTPHARFKPISARLPRDVITPATIPPQSVRHRKQDLNGLFIQQQNAHIHPSSSSYAQPRKDGSPPLWTLFKIPQGFQLLGKGTGGYVFVSHDSRIVLKYFKKDSEALHEFEMTSKVVRLAPQYTAGPVDLLFQRPDPQQPLNHVHLETHRRPPLPPEKCWYVLRSMNAGPTMDYRMQHAALRLTPNELCLCLLQTIHFLLLLGNDIEVGDFTFENVCASRAGADIQLRWIDLQCWEIPDKSTIEPWSTLTLNTLRLCHFREWKTLATEDEYTPVIDVLTDIQWPLIQPGAALTQTHAMEHKLKDIAQHLCRILASGKSAKDPDHVQCIHRSQTLLHHIQSITVLQPAEDTP